MSAFPPIATAKADIGNPSCLLYPGERTCAAQTVMSALGHKRTSPTLLVESPFEQLHSLFQAFDVSRYVLTDFGKFITG